MGSKMVCSALHAEPSNLVLIESDLWLGNLAATSDQELLAQKKIRFILTVNSFQLPKKFVGLNCPITKYIKVFDTPGDDLLSHFEETYEFINNSLKRGAVLVHCYHGVSRSPTVVIAYLMKKKNLTMEEALTCVKSKHNYIDPNSGFLAQLKLYQIMNCTLDESNIQYKKFRLFLAAGHVEKESIIPEYYIDVIKADPVLVMMNENCTIYRCKKCRRVLAQDSNVIPHTPMEKYSWSECFKNLKICQFNYFIEPLAWMENIANSVEGKLYCPNKMCKNKLGSYSWIIGFHCSCGTHVYPGFCLIPSKIDKQTIGNAPVKS